MIVTVTRMTDDLLVTSFYATNMSSLTVVIVDAGWDTMLLPFLINSIE